VKIHKVDQVTVQEIMQKNVVSVHADSSLKEFAESVSARHRHSVFPVYNDRQLLGTISVWNLVQIDSRKWAQIRVGDLVLRSPKRIAPTCDVMEALRLLLSDVGEQMLLVTDPAGRLEGIVTKTDILGALRIQGERRASAHDLMAATGQNLLPTGEGVNA
jgi:CIC family chloride channel protein